MNPIQAKMFIEEILSKPTIHLAAQYVHANAQWLDDTFFQVLLQMIQEEQERSHVSPAIGIPGMPGSVVDNLLDQASSASDWLWRLQMLYDYATQLRQQMASQTSFGQPPVPEEDDRFLELLNQFQRTNAEEETVERDEHLDDLGKARLLMAIDRRYMTAMLKVMPGMASEEVIWELKAILADYERLLQAGLPQYPFCLCKAEDIRGKMADVIESIARAYDSLRNSDRTRLYYEQAAQAYEKIGQQEKANRCRVSLARLKLSVEENVDEEIERLYSILKAVPQNTLQHVDILVELGTFYCNRDDFEAEQILLKAESELQELGYTNPTGTELADVLTQSMMDILSDQGSSGPSPIESMMQVQSLYRLIYMSLEQTYRNIENLEAAEKYGRLLKQMDGTLEDGNELNQDFSDQMSKSTDSLLKQLNKFLNED